MEMGSLADWVSGLGTLAATATAVSIYRADRKRATRAAPDGIYVDRHISEVDYLGNITYEVQVRLINGGPHLVGEVILVGPRDKHGDEVMPSDVSCGADGELIRTAPSRPVLDVSSEVEMVLTYDTKPDLKNFYVGLRDVRGRRWWLGVDSRRALGRRATRRRKSLKYTTRDVTLVDETGKSV
jgi:hypothetical protein